MLSNSYLLGPNGPGEAILIDPGQLDTNLLMMIEDNQLYIKGVLITHFSTAHTRGLKTLLKVYDATVYAHRNALYDLPYHPLTEGEILNFKDFSVTCRFVSDHSADSVMYQVNNWLFTGDVLSAGDMGATENVFKQGNLKAALHERLEYWPETLQLFPGYGPPSSVEGEKMWNPAAHQKAIEP